jgi:hypothetical protein
LTRSTPSPKSSSTGIFEVRISSSSTPKLYTLPGTVTCIE